MCVNGNFGISKICGRMPSVATIYNRREPVMSPVNPGKKGKKEPQPRIVVNLTAEQEKVLEQFRAKQQYRPEIKQIVNAALKEHLGNQGAVWPDPD
jgi:hypothetical protein